MASRRPKAPPAPSKHDVMLGMIAAIEQETEAEYQMRANMSVYLRGIFKLIALDMRNRNAS